MDIKYPKLEYPKEYFSPVVQGRHVVKEGETLFSIARQYDLQPEELRKYNGMFARQQILPGQELQIPPKGKALTLEKAIKLSRGSSYAAASRIQNAWQYFTGKYDSKNMNAIRDFMGWQGDIKVNYTRRSYFPLKLLSILLYSGISPRLQALSHFYQQAKELCVKTSAKLENKNAERLSNRSTETLLKCLDFLAQVRTDGKAIKGKHPNRLTDYYFKTRFTDIKTRERGIKFVNTLLDNLVRGGIAPALLSSPEPHGLNQMDLFLVAMGNVLGW